MGNGALSFGMAALAPARIVPPEKPLGPLAYARAFLRNPLEAIPRAAYFEDVVPFGWGSTPRFWATSPALVRGILVDERDKFRKLTQVRLLAPLLGRGILTSEGPEWRWQRQAAAPMFKPEELERFVPAFVQAAEARLADWAAAPPGQEVAIDAEMSRATFDVIAATLLPSGDADFAPAVREATDVLQVSGGWELLYAALGMPRWLPRPGMLGRSRAVARLRGAVAERVLPGLAGDGATLAHRLRAARDPETGQAMDAQRLVDNLLTFYLAGHETTAKALSWTLYLLARYPEWAARLEDEVARVAGDAPIEARHIEALPLTRQVLSEAMRLYPPVPIMSRQAVADARIEGVEIRAGASVLIPIYAVHRHERRWTQPDAFQPERFAPDREAEIPRYQYMPFGAGPRVCIGRSFATLEAATLLATFVRRARFSLPPGPDPVPVARVTLMARGGLRLEIRPRP